MTTSNILKLATFGDIAGLRQSNNGHQWDKDSAEDKVGIDNSDGKTYNQMLDSVIENDNVVVFIWLTENNFFYGEYLDYGTRRDFEQEILERCNPVKSTKLIGWLKKRLERGNVQTNCFYTRGDEKDDWTLMFCFSLDGHFSFSFCVHEPHLSTEQAWRDLADGKKSVSCYQGNGEGCIDVDANNGDLLFVAAPSGAGGDVTSTFRVPIGEVSEKLHKALDEAKADGRFKTKAD